MIVLISGATHTGKTVLAQKLLEKRLDDSHCTAEYLIHENEQMLGACKKYGLTYILIDDKYDIDICLEN